MVGTLDGAVRLLYEDAFLHGLLGEFPKTWGSTADLSDDHCQSADATNVRYPFLKRGLWSTETSPRIRNWVPLWDEREGCEHSVDLCRTVSGGVDDEMQCIQDRLQAFIANPNSHDISWHLSFGEVLDYAHFSVP